MRLSGTLPARFIVDRPGRPSRMRSKPLQLFFSATSRLRRNVSLTTSDESKAETITRRSLTSREAASREKVSAAEGVEPIDLDLGELLLENLFFGFLSLKLLAKNLTSVGPIRLVEASLGSLKVLFDSLEPVRIIRLRRGAGLGSLPSRDPEGLTQAQPCSDTPPRIAPGDGRRRSVRRRRFRMPQALPRRRRIGSRIEIDKLQSSELDEGATHGSPVNAQKIGDGPRSIN